MTKLYVGNLPYSVTDAELGEYFADYGPVTSADLPGVRIRTLHRRGMLQFLRYTTTSTKRRGAPIFSITPFGVNVLEDYLQYGVVHQYPVVKQELHGDYELENLEEFENLSKEEE